ncbi:Serine/threonine-protein kinase VPS15 [Cyberlindnera fabianii]|uniref:non-specific serine/threonine protein kinase n=1 Tax=Cyberlindnera fabianii TaxID=36022 RepID=A0A1V2L5J8_CYBFA|nr:Serine/threonine-protein kinase VPS15 [Cyberlindnera fabianii]
MGAQLSLMAPTAPSIAVSAYVDVLEEIQYRRQIGTSRFLKTVKAYDPDGAVVIKVFIKPNEGMDLGPWYKALQKCKTSLADVPSVLPYTKIIETERAGYLIRQFINTNLYDRISTRPFLEDIEKKWIAFQLLNTLVECHEREVTHGDIKTENILVTSWNWVLLSDFAPFKPVYLPEDNPGSFSFYFDTSQRRTCYLAPERFLSSEETDDSHPKFNKATKEMDIFSMGCVIAEIFLEGSPIFTLSQLYKYKRGEYTPDLEGIQDPAIKELVESMISIDPKDRLSASEYLESYKECIFPSNFYNFLYEYFKSFNQDIPYNSSGNVYECDTRINRLYNDYDKIAYFLGYTYDTPSELNPEDEEKIQRGELIPIRLSLPGIPKHYNLQSTSKIKETDDTALILLSFVFTALRNVRRETSKIQALELILALAERIHDEGKLDRCLPYITALLDDASINVQSTALKTLTQLLLLVDAIGPVNVSLFPEYIIPRLSSLLNASTPFVRIAFATCLPYLAHTSLRFYDMGVILKDNVLETSFDPETENGGITPSGMFDISKESLSADFETFTISMLTDVDSSVKIALLKNILPLCSFFGKDKTNDLILSHLITYLNDRSPQLRAAFVESVVGLSIYVGTTSLEHYILPLLVQTLSDPEESVVIRVLHIFDDIAKLGLIRRDFIWDLLGTVSRLLLHPNEWIKQAALSLIVTIADTLSLADLYCMLYPIIRPYIEYDVTDFSWDSLYPVCKRSISRTVYNLASTWSLRAEKTLFWQQVKSTAVDVFGNRGLDFLSNPVSSLNGSKIATSNSIVFGNIEIPLSPEDRSWVDRLKTSGLTDQELWKIADLREYIFRVSRMTTRSTSSEFEDKGGINIQRLGVLPRNVFFDSKFQYESFSQSLDGNFASIDDRLNIQSFADPSQSSEISREDDRTLVMSPSPAIDDLSRSLIFGAPKAAPSIMTNEENAFGELDSSTSQKSRRRPSTQAYKLNNTNIMSSVITNSYTGKDTYVIRFLNTVKIDPGLEEYTEFNHPVNVSGLTFSKTWSPCGDLVSHVKEHKSSINTIDVAPDHSYFVTGGDDGSLKVWDTSRLERNVSHSSVISVELDKPITKVKFLSNYNCFAAATKDGYIRVLAVNFSKTKKSQQIDGLTIIRETILTDQYAVDLEFGHRDQKTTLFAVTSLSQIIGIDVRNMHTVFTLQNDPSRGVITSFTVSYDDSWALVGTSKGVMSLWDLRFQVHLRSWLFKNGFPIRKCTACSNDYHLNRKKGRFVTVIGGSGDSDAYIFDVSTGQFREIFARSGASLNLDKFVLTDLEEDENTITELTSDLKNMDVKLKDDKSMTALKVVELQTDARRKFWALTASATYDLILWNVYAPEDSKIILSSNASKNGSDNPATPPSFTVSQVTPHSRIVSEKYPTETESTKSDTRKRRKNRGLVTEEQDALIKGHHDVITDIAVLAKPYEMIVSVDRSGTINVYR